MRIMTKSRRKFLKRTSLGLLAASAAEAQTSSPPAGAPPAFNTSPAVGPEVSDATFAEAEKLVQVTMTQQQRAMAAKSWRTSMASLYERRTGPRKVRLEPTLAPWSRWNATLPGQTGPVRSRFFRSNRDPGPLPERDEDIAYAPLTRLARWIEKGQLSSVRLTNIYLERLIRFNPTLRCVITMSLTRALAEARQADREIAPDTTGARCTVFHGVRRICSIQPIFRQPTVRSPLETVYRKMMPWW